MDGAISMAVENRRPRVHVDKDGVKVIEPPRVRWGVWLTALCLIALSVGLFLWPPTGVSPPVGNTQRAELPSSGELETPSRPRPPGFKPVRRFHRLQQPQVQQEPPRLPVAEQNPEQEAAPADPETAEQPSGIELFPPPGTDPPKSGLIVPEDFELPTGYVRHYQATDDGQRLPAILMFHPDYDWVDENGQPLEIPENRIVPPELAPPGLPLESLEVPETNIPFVEQPGSGEQPAAD
jgi:hypothetical protein